jgi:hypothetical protein
MVYLIRVAATMEMHMKVSAAIAVLSATFWGEAIAAAESSPPCDRPGPIRVLPAWAHLGEYATDGWIGGHHDAQSGAFVTYAFGRGEKPVFGKGPNARA